MDLYSEDTLDEYLEHYGTPRHSGRYPWGSGKDPYQHTYHFVSQYQDYKNQGLTEKEIASAMGIVNHRGEGDVSKLRARYSRAREGMRKDMVAQVVKLKEKGYSNTAIGRELGINESSVRSYLNPISKSRMEQMEMTETVLKNAIKDKNIIDVGPGTELEVGVTRTKLDTAISDMEDQGYSKMVIRIPQAGNPGKETAVTVLAKPGTTYKEAYDAVNTNKLGYIQSHIEESPVTGKLTAYGIEKPRSISSDRVRIKYAEEGGTDMDGVILIRRGQEDLDLGTSRYAQVRIAVDDTHYLKGMAMYSDDLPKGVDVVFNTNKSKGTPMLGSKDNTVLKPMKDDPDNPFGSSIVQHHYVDKNGKEQLSALNIVGSRETDEHKEGEWGTWSKTISAQFVSKQDPKVAKRQLDKMYTSKLDEYNDIMKVTNPVIRKKKLADFAEACDSNAAHLEAAGFSRQATHVILPFPNMKKNEIYAPKYKNGEEVALVRFPHAGTFEIPTLIVNNTDSNPAKKAIYNAKDAVGIHPDVAKILSGADFDGDTVVVIPTAGQNLKTRKTMEKNNKLPESLKNIQDFPDQINTLYALPESAPKMKKATKGNEMGKVSNLITDMTIMGAKPDEIARAVKHSMVVIDAEKHHLDYKKSAQDQGITELKKKYQVKENDKYGGAATLISRAKADARVNQRKDYTLSKNTIDEDGNKIYKETGRHYTQIYAPVIDEKTGQVVTKTSKNGTVKEVYAWRAKRKGDVITPETKTKEIWNQSKTTQMDLTKNAETLMSGPNHEGTPIERVYAAHANRMKSLANTARKESVATKGTTYDPSAAKTYASEVSSLMTKLMSAKKAAPLERKAQIIANSVIKQKIADNPDMTSEEKKKIKGQALNAARYQVNNGKARYRIDITDKEWEAIQAGALRNTKVSEIINNANKDRLNELSMPKTNTMMTTSKISRMNAMYANGYSLADIASALGVSASTVSKYLNQ